MSTKKNKKDLPNSKETKESKKIKKESSSKKRTTSKLNVSKLKSSNKKIDSFKKSFVKENLAFNSKLENLKKTKDKVNEENKKTKGIKLEDLLRILEKTDLDILKVIFENPNMNETDRKELIENPQLIIERVKKLFSEDLIKQKIEDTKETDTSKSFSEDKETENFDMEDTEEDDDDLSGPFISEEEKKKYRIRALNQEEGKNTDAEIKAKPHHFSFLENDKIFREQIYRNYVDCQQLQNRIEHLILKSDEENKKEEDSIFSAPSYDIYFEDEQKYRKDYIGIFKKLMKKAEKKLRKLRIFKYPQAIIKQRNFESENPFGYNEVFLKRGPYIREMFNYPLFTDLEKKIVDSLSEKTKFKFAIKNTFAKEIYDFKQVIKDKNLESETDDKYPINLYPDLTYIYEEEKCKSLLEAKGQYFPFVPLEQGVAAVPFNTFELVIKDQNYFEYFMDIIYKRLEDAKPNNEKEEQSLRTFNLCLGSIRPFSATVGKLGELKKQLPKDVAVYPSPARTEIKRKEEENALVYSEMDVYQYATLVQAEYIKADLENHSITLNIKVLDIIKIYDFLYDGQVTYASIFMGQISSFFDMPDFYQFTKLTPFELKNILKIDKPYIKYFESICLIHENKKSDSFPFEYMVELMSIIRQYLIERIIDLMAESEGNFEKFKTQVHRIKGFDKIEILIYYTASILDPSFNDKITLLEGDFKAILSVMIKALLEQEKLYNINHKIEVNYQKDLEESQREYYLRSRIKAIYKELGEGENMEDEREKYLKILKEKNLSEAIYEQLKGEVTKLVKAPHGSPEGSIQRNYLDLVCDLPWGKCDVENMDLRLARQRLNESHKHMDKVKERILEYLSVRKLQRLDHDKVSPTILCLVGPPGVGKTSIAQSMAAAVGRKFVRMSLGGIRDEAEIRGHRRTYVGAMPGRLINAIRRIKTDNPLILLDEIDKMGNDYKGDPSSAMLEILDPGQNKDFRDHYLELPYDFSKVLFVTTANDLRQIPEPLLDRLEIIQLDGYSDLEKLSIAKDHLWPLIKEDFSYKHQLDLQDDVILNLIRKYTRESGVRSLKRILERILRKIILRQEEGLEVPEKMTIEFIDSLLKEDSYQVKSVATHNPAGMVTGLAWTSVGGDVLNIEVLSLPGKGKLELTGNLGNVMKESVKVAITFIKSIATTLELENDYFEKHDLHIHVPEGATPKDGPSAGITLALAIASAVTQKPVSSKVAMTGELSMMGKVMAIGGLKEKLLAAKRYGIETVYFPKDNEKDVKLLADDVKEGLKLVSLDNIRTLFSETLGYIF